MTKEQFDQFKNKILKLSDEAEAFWEEYKTLQTTKEKAIHLLRDKNYQLAVRTQELQKAKNEVKNFKSHLREAIKKIKQLEGEKKQILQSRTSNREPSDDVVDLKKIANDFDAKLEKKKDEKTLNYLKDW